MKTMNNYSLYCTQEQTKKALELGAPIEYAKVVDTINGNSIRIPEETGEFYLIPTTEQMISWLEEQESITAINIDYYVTGNSWACWIKFKEGILNKQDFGSRKEATLAAIDAALEYLTNKK